MRLQALIDLFDNQVEKLVEAGVPPDSIADALKVVATRTQLLHGASADSLRKLGAVANRLKALADGQNAQPPLTPDANHPVMADDADLLRRVADIMQEND